MRGYTRFSLDGEFYELPCSRVGYVYFVEAVGTDRMKIGWTRNITGRLSSLRTGCPHKLRLVAMLTGSKDAEKSYHLAFADDRLEGEWFHLSEKLRDFVDAVRLEPTR